MRDSGIASKPKVKHTHSHFLKGSSVANNLSLYFVPLVICVVESLELNPYPCAISNKEEKHKNTYYL